MVFKAFWAHCSGRKCVHFSVRFCAYFEVYNDNYSDNKIFICLPILALALLLMACRPLFRRSGFLFILIALWPLTFFKHGYDGYHKASLVNSCAFGNGITENKASNFASCPWNHNGLIIRTARGKGYFSARINYHSCCVSRFHLIRLFISEDVCLNPGPDKCENCGQATTRNHGCLSAPCRISSIYSMAGHNKPHPRSVTALAPLSTTALDMGWVRQI